MSFKKVFFAILKVGITLAIVLSMAIPVSAAALVTPASGGGAISADNATVVSWTTLGAIVITEQAAGDIAIGVFVLTIPSGFVFDTSSVPDVAVTGTTPQLAANTPAAIAATTITVTVTANSTAEADNVLTLGGVTPIKVRPTAGTPLASGNITMTAGTIAGVSGTTNFGTLTEVHGAADQYVIIDPTDGTVDAAITVTVQLQDQFGNKVTTGGDKDTDVTLNADGSATGDGVVDIINGDGTRDISDQVAETVNLSLTDHLSTTWDVASTQDVVFAAAPEGEVGGGGGIKSPPGTTYVYDIVTTEGEFTEDVTTKSEDGNVELAIDEGTIGLTKNGKKLMAISIDEMEAPPDPPKESNRIGLTYDLEPDGATFDPPISLTFHYDPDEIPEGVSEENLIIAMWDEEASEWVDLECVVDPETNTITASVSHFTAFTVVAFSHPAAFETSYLTILPGEVDPDEEVTIGVKVTNTGDLSGSYEVTLKIDGVAVATQEVTLEGGASQKVTFTTSKDVAGTYNVNVNGLSSTFTVTAPPAPPAPAPPVAPPPAPAPAPPVAPLPVAPPPAVFNWGLIGGIIAAVVVVVLLVYFLWWRRRVA